MTTSKVLSLCPGSRQIGYAYFENGNLVDWGIKGNTSGPIPERMFRRGLRLISEMVAEFVPETVVFPSLESHPRRISSYRFVRAAAAILISAGCRVVFRSPANGLEHFTDLLETKPTKHQIAVALAKIFPELQRLVPLPRRAWDPQDYWTQMFDAVAQGYSWIQSHHEK
jgi:hypothetical protein